MKLTDFRLGATGRHPHGQADASDDGELRMAMVTDHANGIVRIVFGTPVAWIGLPSREARELGTMLLEKADEIDRRKG